MSFLSQSQMTQEGLDKMFKFWDQHAPKEPNQGWFGSMRSVWDSDSEHFYSCPIEDYDNDAIDQIGTGRVNCETGEYTEIYF